MPPQSAATGSTVRLGHGDAMHVTDIDPNRPGLEIFTVHEGATFAPYGYALRDAATGEVLYGDYTGRDTGRGMIGDVDPAVPGLETWATRLRAAGRLTELGAATAAPARTVHQVGGRPHDADRERDAARHDTTIDDWHAWPTADGDRHPHEQRHEGQPVARRRHPRRLARGTRRAHGGLLGSADLRSTEVTDHKLATLMHDTQYRAEVARQQTTYNQPSYTGWYLASDMDFADVEVPDYYTPRYGW